MENINPQLESLPQEFNFRMTNYYGMTVAAGGDYSGIAQCRFAALVVFEANHNATLLEIKRGISVIAIIRK